MLGYFFEEGYSGLHTRVVVNFRHLVLCAGKLTISVPSPKVLRFYFFYREPPFMTFMSLHSQYNLTKQFSTNKSVSLFN